MRRLRRSTFLLLISALGFTLSASGAQACEPDPRPSPEGQADVYAGTIEYGTNNGTGGHAGYVAPGGGAYAFVGGNDRGAQIWVGAGDRSAFTGLGPGYVNLNCVYIS